MPQHITAPCGRRYPAASVAAIDAELRRLAQELRYGQASPIRRRVLRRDCDALLEGRLKLQVV